MIIHKKISIILFLIGMCTILGACNSLDGSEKANKEYANLDDHYKITDVADNKGAVVIIDGYVMGNGMIMDGGYYVPYEDVREYMDDHYYWDKTEKILTYASSKHIYDATDGAAEYTVDGEK